MDTHPKPLETRRSSVADDAAVELTYAASAGGRGRISRRAVWIGVAIPLACFGFLAMSFSSCPRCLSPEAECAANLRGIGQAMYIYAMNEPDRMFPDDVQKLIDANTAIPKQFICRSAPTGHQCYLYVPGASEMSPPRTVLMFEDPRNHGGKGGNVLYQDGRVVFEKAPALQSIVNANKTKAR
ncbi:MAG: hypothetical protein H6819_03015 [Phycisphaerales bacterium]|nr:hypothetical protein [Phycisphaerales bacterium]MCB9856168.1 hypothetical protein [Phycisphaerales bacterium]